MKKLALFLSLFTLLLLPASQTIEAQQLGQKVYWMATIEVPVGQLSAYHAFAEKELVPIQEKHGYHFIATWQTIVGDIEEVLVICEFESMAAYHEARVSLLTSEEWKAVGPKFSAMTKGIKSRFLSAAPYSKIK
jgi:hypothetical protein